MQVPDPKNWHTTRELLRTNHEIQVMAGKAVWHRKDFLTQVHKDNIQEHVQGRPVQQSVETTAPQPGAVPIISPTVNQTEREARFDRIKKQMATTLNQIGMTDGCVFQRLGYFRCVYHTGS